MKYIQSIFITILLVGSCTINKEYKMPSPEPKFTLIIQHAGYNYNQYDEKGEIDYLIFIKSFESFPWIEEIENYLKNKKGCSPTLSVQDHFINNDLWVSMAGDKNDHAYLIGIVKPKIIRKYWGFGKPTTVKWVTIFITKDENIIKECFALFFSRKSTELSNMLIKMEKFDEMKAYNQN
jgi:hypothetical protein